MTQFLKSRVPDCHLNYDPIRAGVRLQKLRSPKFLH